jgi:AraC-like DNA-binding protein
MAVGYNDTGNFSIAFKSHFGYSPGAVQKNRTA